MRYIEGTVLIDTKYSDDNKNTTAKNICDLAHKHGLRVFVIEV